METVNRFFAFLSLGCVALVVTVVGLLATRRRPGSAQWLEAIRAQALPLAFLVAATAMAGSLYYSEIENFNPCRLCWAQRGFMYPTAIVLGVALVTGRRRRRLLGWLGLGLSAVGLGVALYHRAEQQFPDSVGGSCDISNPCSGRWVDTFGFVTIPTMAAAGFAAVVALLALTIRDSPEQL